MSSPPSLSMLPRPPRPAGHDFRLTAEGLELNPQRHRGWRSFQGQASLPCINASNNGPHLISSAKALDEKGMKS